MRARDRPNTTPCTHSLPWWVHGLDVVSLFILLLLASAVLFGGVRASVFELRLSATGIPRLLLLAAVVIGARHYLFNQPSLSRRLLDGFAAMRRSHLMQAVMPVFLVSRVSVLVVGLLAVLIVGYPQESVPFRVSENEFLNLPAKWDAGWYLGIVSDGYRGSSNFAQQQPIAFFPAYPVMMRASGHLLGAGTTTPYAPPVNTDDTRGGRFLWGGVAAALAAFFMALVYVYRLARDDHGDKVALASVALLSAYPFAIFFSAPYTESLFLLGNVAAFYHFRRGDDAAAAGWALLTGLTKPNGIVLGLPLLLIWLGRAEVFGRNGAFTLRPDFSRVLPHARGLLVVAMPALGTLSFSVYSYTLLGDPLAWVYVQQEAWNRGFDSVGGLMRDRFGLIGSQGLDTYLSRRPVEFLNGLATLFALALFLPIARRLGLAYASFLVVMVIPPLVAGGLYSMGRFTSVLFPMFVYLGVVLPQRWQMALVCTWVPFQALSAVAFFTWRPLY